MFEDYPAAHSMDSAWYAVDERGQVALFQPGMDGASPFHDGRIQPERVATAILSMVGSRPDETEEDLENRVERDVDAAHASSGLYVYTYPEDDWSEQFLNTVALPYRLTHQPDQPLHVDQLPPNVRAEMESISLPGVHFGGGAVVQPVGVASGVPWYSYTAELSAYLDLDGVTVRVIPGREDHFSQDLDVLVSNLGEEASRLRFDPPLG
jgi:hypothetical protein